MIHIFGDPSMKSVQSTTVVNVMHITLPIRRFSIV